MKRELIIPTLLTVLGLAVLISLGSWQLKRHIWKQDILTRIEQNLQKPPLSYETWNGIQTASNPDNRNGHNFSEFDYVSLRGRFDHDKEIYVYAVQKGMQGYFVFTPLILENNAAILVKRGFVQDQLREAQNRRDSLVTGFVEVKGLTRFTEQESWLTPEPNMQKRIWYRVNLNQIRTALNIPISTLHFIQAEEAANDVKTLQASNLQDFVKAIPNRHMEYALTWFGLALTLIGVYIAFVVSVFRKKQS